MKLTVLLLFCSSLITIVYGDAVPKIADPNAREANSGEFPFQVSIQYNCQPTCGGSLISEKHVLTAAHCVADYVQDVIHNHVHNQWMLRMTVEVGSTWIGWGITHDIKRISYKDDYDPNKDSRYIIPNDVAVITLMHPIEVTDSAKPIDIYQGELWIGQKLTVSGFGNVQKNQSGSPYLKVDYVKAVSLEECASLWPGRILLSSQICATELGHGVCQGDSGGPLTLEMEGKQFLVGVVSAGNETCGTYTPDIYTRASKFMDYITNERSYDFTTPEVPGAIGVNLCTLEGGLPKSGSPKCKQFRTAQTGPQCSRYLRNSRPPRQVPMPSPGGYPFPLPGYYPALPIVHPHPPPINFPTAPLGSPHFLPSGQLLHPSPGLHPVFPTNEFSSNNVYLQAQPAGFLQLAPAHQLQPTWQAG